MKLGTYTFLSARAKMRSNAFPPTEIPYSPARHPAKSQNASSREDQLANGQLDKNSDPFGIVRIITKRGCIYEGQWKDGFPNGFGRFIG